MTLGLPLYQVLTRIVSLFLGTILSRRVRRGKEDANRLNERRSRQLTARPAGRIVWLHAASVGESLILLELGKRLQTKAPDIHLLFTSQTRTSAELIAKNLPAQSLHQMAPIDTPGNAKRFIRHWQPALGIMAEGEIWPNLIRRAKANGTRLALVNARMTEKSLNGWKRWRRTAQKVIGKFDRILAADEQTATGLEELVGASVATPGNLKASLPPPEVDAKELARLLVGFKDDRDCLFAASTHDGEEELVVEALSTLNVRPKLVVAPRHPERGDAIENVFQEKGFSISRRSRGDPISTETDILLADTLGEMGLWYRLADTIYLGGGHAKGVGGHNPLEPLKLGKSVITGPHVFNFADMMKSLEVFGAVRFAPDPDALARLFQTPCPLDQAKLSAWLSEAEAPMTETINALLLLLEGAK